jgi:hypothetical protein
MFQVQIPGKLYGGKLGVHERGGGDCHAIAALLIRGRIAHHFQHVGKRGQALGFRFGDGLGVTHLALDGGFVLRALASATRLFDSPGFRSACAHQKNPIQILF